MKTMDLIENGVKVFKDGALGQLEQESTFIVGAAAGLYQGLKYNGNLIRGINAGVATVITLAVTNGLVNVINNRNSISKKASESK